MKILCLADLHIPFKKIKIQDQFFRKQIKQICEMSKPDIIVIAGDILSHTMNPHEEVYSYFGEYCQQVICVLGNHEFYHHTFKKTLAFYAKHYDPDKFNVHYLDLVEHFDIIHNDKKYRFLGNVLFYDGSMKDTNHVIEEWGGFNKQFGRYAWADAYIREWAKDWKQASKFCQQQIIKNMSKDKDMTSILVTHTVPHEKLNMHPTGSIYNTYSGVAKFLEQHKFDYAICGHTHKRSIGQVINGCQCVNVGYNYVQDYKLEYFVLEV